MFEAIEQGLNELRNPQLSDAARAVWEAGWENVWLSAIAFGLAVMAALFSRRLTIFLTGLTICLVLLWSRSIEVEEVVRHAIATLALMGLAFLVLGSISLRRLITRTENDRGRVLSDKATIQAKLDREIEWRMAGDRYDRQQLRRLRHRRHARRRRRAPAE